MLVNQKESLLKKRNKNINRLQATKINNEQK